MCISKSVPSSTIPIWALNIWTWYNFLKSWYFHKLWNWKKLEQHSFNFTLGTMHLLQLMGNPLRAANDLGFRWMLGSSQKSGIPLSLRSQLFKYLNNGRWYVMFKCPARSHSFSTSMSSLVSFHESAMHQRTHFPKLLNFM